MVTVILYTHPIPAATRLRKPRRRVSFSERVPKEQEQLKGSSWRVGLHVTTDHFNFGLLLLQNGRLGCTYCSKHNVYDILTRAQGQSSSLLRTGLYCSGLINDEATHMYIEQL